MRWMGIDGGGSHVRVVIVDDAMVEIAAVQGGAVNPNSVGRDESAARIREAVTSVLQQSHLSTVTGAGIGIAGASAEHSAAWLRDILSPLLPGTNIYPSSDVEIALVGGRGCLYGLMLLVGTGSIAYGVNREGHSHQAGGWGYLLGDEGSGYWIGVQAIRAVTHYGDGRLGVNSQLPQRVMGVIHIQKPLEIIHWMYHEASPKDVAQLAELVLTAAAAGDTLARSIIRQAADHLVALATHVQKTLDLNRDTITYGGGLLTSDNALSHAVTQKLGLSAPPQIQYKPVIGAALLAQLKEKKDAH